MQNLYTLLLILLISINTQAQDSGSIAEKYKGTLAVPGLNLDMAIKLLNESGTWTGTLDIPMQNIKAMQLSDLKIEDNGIYFALPEVPGQANYTGTFNEDFSKIAGTFSQGGQKFELEFKSEDGEAKAKDLATVERLKFLSDSLMQAHHIPGMGFGIIKEGEVILSEGFGYRDYENKIKADDETIFAIGSCSKAFTAAGVAMLADKGLIEWDEPVKTYMPDFEMHDKFASQQSTPLDLLTHRSGLPRHDLLWYGSKLDRHELFSKLKHLEATEGFRTTFQYQNLMYMSAGILIERMTDKTWEEFTQESIFNPLGMSSTNFSVAKSQEVENHALPYRLDDDEVIKMDFRNIDNVAPAGSINSNVKDMLKWAELNLNRGTWNGQQILDESQFNVLHSPQMLITGPLASRLQPEFSTPTYGGGWFIYDYSGTKVVQHGGNIDGFSGYVYLLPDQDIGMVFMINTNGSPLASVLANYATDLFLGNEEIKWEKRVWKDEDEDDEEEEEEDHNKKDEGRIANTKPSRPIAEFVGKYENEGYGTAEIKIENGNLKAYYNSFEMPMTHYHYDVYEAQIDPSQDDMFKIKFEQDMGGSIQSFKLSLEPALDPYTFTKIAEPQHEDPKYRALVVGTYHLAGLDVHIKDENGKLIMAPVGQPSWELESYKKDEFKPKGLPGFSMKFKFKDGKANELVMFQPNGTFVAERIED